MQPSRRWLANRLEGIVLFRWFLYPIGKLVLGILFTLFGPTVVRGRKNVPRKGGLLVLANHTSDADPPLMGLATPRPVYFMAKHELFGIPVLGALMRWYRAFPIRRGTADRAALRRAIELLQNGQCVVMFPEGECSETGRLLRILPGAALVIRQSGAPVICCGIRNNRRLLPYGKLIPRPAFAVIRVEFGLPRTFERSATEQEISGWIESELRRLSHQEQVI